MNPQEMDEDQRCLNLELFVAINYGLKRKNVTQEEVIERVRESLCNGADINAIHHNNAGSTALHVAVRRHFGQVIQVLMEHGANVDIENSQGLTALKLAQMLKCDQKIIESLEGYAKSATIALSIIYLSNNQTIWNKLKNNSEIAVLEVNSVELSPDFLQQVEFYDAIDTAGNLFFVDVMLSDNAVIDEEFIVSELQRMSKEVIIQCGSVLETKVYCRRSEAHLVVISLNTIVEPFDEKILIDRLSGKDGFGLGLLVEALKLNLVGKFETERRSLLNVSINLEKELECWKLIDFVIRNGDAITARLLSLNPSDLSKVNSSKTSTLTLAAQHGDVEKLAAVLRVKFPIQLNGNISLPKESAAHFDKCKKEMLESAVRAGNCGVISFMIRCGVQLDEDIIQLAWDDKLYDVVLFLLRADCVFPYDIDLDEVDVNDANFIELRHFIEERDQLHDLIKEGQLNSVKEFLKLIAPSKLYLDKENRSAVYKALKFNHFNVFVWLKSDVKAEFKDDMERRSLGVGVLDSATDALVPHFVPIDNAHILHLVAKSRSHRHYEGFIDHIESIYTELNTIPQISTVLKVIQFCDNVDIIYDFENDSIVDVNVASSENVTGFCEYKVGRIYIGAKVSQQQLLGTVSHELTHLAIQTIYDNDCKPYKLGDSIKEEFDEIIKETRNQSTPVDPIIGRAFSCYGEIGWASELIVRVNHMLAYYGSTDGLGRLKVQAKSLVEFYTKNVEKRFENLVSESHLIKPRYLIKVLNDNAGVISKMEDSKIKLKKSMDVREVFSENEVQIAVVTSTSPFLSTMSVYQSLQGINQQPNSFMIFNFDGYVKRRIEINQAFYSDVCDFLVLFCESVPEKRILSASLKGLAQVLWKKSNKKIIFIMENCELSNDEVNELVNLSLRVYCDVEYTLDDVRVESAKLLLDQSVSLQCRDANIKLCSLIDEEHYRLVDVQTLLKLINKQPIVIGKQIIASSNHYDEHFYIDRKFCHQALIKEEVLKDEDASTMYAISDINEATMVNLVKRDDPVCKFKFLQNGRDIKYVIVDTTDGAQQYQHLCKQFPQHNIHWLKKIHGGFQWLESRCIKGDLTRLQTFVKDQLVDQYSEVELAEQVQKHNVVLVTDTAGMGKSTVLISVALQVTEQDPLLWLIRVNLSDYTKVLDEEQENVNNEINQSNKVLNYFVDRLLGSRVETKLETEFERNLLLHFLQHNEDRVVVMFDGFDEIKESHQNVIKDVLVALKSSKVKQLWVTTRPHMRKTLENTLHHLTYTMQPLTETDQVNFLTRFWKLRLISSQSDMESGGSFDAKLQCFAKALIKLLSESISDREKEFTGVPLQLRLIAEGFEEDVEMFCKADDEQPDLPPKFKLNDLYQNFFFKKYKIFQSEKNKVEFNKLNMESQNDVLKEFFLDSHQIASLFTLFDESERELLLTTDEIKRGVSFVSDISKHKISTGLIDTIIEGKPRFVHLTFAEYLTAEFIVNILAKEQPSIELIKLIFKKVFIDGNFKVVRAFIESHLAEKTLTDAVLKKHGKVLRSVYSEKLNISQFGKFISGVFRGRNKSRIFPYKSKTWCVLHVTAEEGNSNVANFLINCVRKCNIRAKLIKGIDDDGVQALHLAAQHGHLDVVKLLVEHKAEVNAAVSGGIGDYRGLNALSLAAYFGHTDICEWLINNGADIYATASVGYFRGQNVLDIAFAQGQLDVVKMLKNVTKFDFTAALKPYYYFCNYDQLNTALHRMAYRGHWDLVKWIVSEGFVGINYHSKILGYDTETLLIKAIDCGPPEMVEWLIEHNADVNIGCTRNGNAALHMAVSWNKLNIAKMLVYSGANVNAVNDGGRTALHMTAEWGQEELAELLLTAKDIDVNAIDTDGWTPLHRAAFCNQLNVVKILLSNGAHVNAVNIEGKTPLHSAVEFKYDLLFKYKNIDVNVTDETSWTPLLQVPYKKQLNVVKFLVSNNANVNSVANKGESLLHLAAYRGCHLVVEFLLTVKDIDVNAVDKDGWTPLHRAAYKNRLNVVKILVSNNANVNAVTNEGESPLHVAAYRGCHLVVEFLLTVKDIDIHAVDRDGRTPLQVASGSGFVYPVESLTKLAMKSKKRKIKGCTIN